MTIEELLNVNVDELERMSDADLLTHFKPYLIVTQPPTSTDKPTVINIAKPKARKGRTLEQQMQELANLHGVKLEKGTERKTLPANLR